MLFAFGDDFGPLYARASSSTSKARPTGSGRRRAARSFHADVRRFSHLINTEQIFGTHTARIDFTPTRFGTCGALCLFIGTNRLAPSWLRRRRVFRRMSLVDTTP